MVLAFIQQIETAQVLINSASNLATQLLKSFGILCFVDAEELILERETELKKRFPNIQITIRNSKMSLLSEICDELDASFLFLQLLDTNSKSIKSLLDASRNLRIPYV